MGSNNGQVELLHIPEPRLTFGFGQKLVDVRDGITLFGPFTQDKLTGQLNVGIIGPRVQRKALKDYLEKIHKPVYNEKQELARPFFPGLEAAFGICINFNNIPEIDVPLEEIAEYLRYTDGHQRVHNLCNLYSDRLIRYGKEEEMPVNVWFVVIPDEIYLYGRPKSKIPFSEENIRLGLSKRQRDPRQGFLFDELNQLKDAYEFEVNFHNQLKAKLLSSRIVTQIIRESTINYSELWKNDKKIEEERKFDTAKAWNISTTLYYKAGGLPWRLGDVREGVCYIGLVYKKLHTDEIDRNACCAAQMFLDSGDGVVFKGNIGPWYNPKTKEFHIKRVDAKDLLAQSLNAFKEKSQTDNNPKEIFIHAKTYFDDEEWEGFSAVTKGKAALVGVRICDDMAIKLFRDYTYCVPRGTVLRISASKALLWSKGFIPRLQTQLGLETPNPLDIEVARGKQDITTVCKDILALTKLNYNACIYGDGLPVTLRFADSIGEVLTAGQNIETGVLPFKHYV